MSEVQKSISTIPRAPSSVYTASKPRETEQDMGQRTHSVDPPEGVTICDTVAFTRAN